jgi:hypothetical protein
VESPRPEKSKPPVKMASPPHAVGIRFVLGYGYGGCRCYGGAEMEIGSGKATLLKTPIRECQHKNPQKYRVLRVDADLSDKHWRELQQLSDRDALFALPDKIPCPQCTGDEGSEFVEVRFSDRTKKSVALGSESVPNEVEMLLEQLVSLEGKLEDELPGSCD